MSTARILIQQGEFVYRFLRFETSPDGSLIAFLDRDSRSKIGSMQLNGSGTLVPANLATDRRLPSGRFSIHTTGEVHRYFAGNRENTIYIEPLHRLTRLAWIGFVSLPKISRLDPLDLHRDRHDVAATLEIPRCHRKAYLPGGDWAGSATAHHLWRCIEL